MIEELERIAALKPWEQRPALLALIDDLKAKPQKLPRSSAQNRALHAWMTELATELNDRGLYMQEVLKPSIEIEWTMDLVKSYIVHPLAEAIAQTNRTSELSSVQLSQVITIIDQNLLAKHGIDLPFTHEQEM